MDEILGKLLESDLLNEETKTALRAQLTEAAEQMKQQIREEVEVEVRAELTEQFVSAREELVDALDELTTAVVHEEVEELKEDIEHFRDLEAEYAEKEVTNREQLAEQLKGELDQLVDKLDQFLDLEINTHFEELKEDLESAQRDQFGRKIFEAFEATFRDYRRDNLPEVERELAETKDRLQDTTRRLAEAEKQRMQEARETKLSSMLAPLTGMQRKHMKVILESVPTERLDAAFKLYIPRVLREDTGSKEEKQVVTESQDRETLVEGTELVTGDKQVVAQTVSQDDDELRRMRRLAGV